MKHQLKDCLIVDIKSLCLKEETVVYIDFESTKNCRELLIYLNKKAKRLKALGFSNSQILDIIILGDDFQNNILVKSHYILITHYITENIDLLATKDI
jgi:hypothetical protein